LDNVYVLVKNKKEEKVKGESENESKVYRYNFSEKEITEIKIEIEKSFISEIKMTINSNGEIFCTGFYSDKSENYMKGIFYLELDPENNTILNLKYKDFENSLLKEFGSDNGTYHKGDFSKFKIIDVIEKPTGGYYFITEHQFERSGTGDGSSNHYAYRHILLGQLSKDGTVEKVTLIPKRQVTINDEGYFSGFSYGIKGESLYLIFNDNEKNSTTVKPEKLKQLFIGSGVLVIVEIKENGKMIKTPLFKSKFEKTIIAPRFGVMLPSGLIVNHCLIERNFRMISIDIE
jgi:hypothetical protein